MGNADPLAELRDIHLPAAIGAWPPAPGWWMLAALLLLGLALCAWFCYRHWRRNAYRRAALAALASQRDLQQLNRLLKRCAIARYGQAKAAALHGQAWVDFLQASCRKPPFSADSAALLASATYAPGDHRLPPGLRQEAQRWLRRHR